MSVATLTTDKQNKRIFLDYIFFEGYAVREDSMPFFMAAASQPTLEAFRFLVRKVGILQILVRHADVRVPRLVSGNHDTLGVRKVTDARVLQAVKLVTVGKVQRLTHLAPLVPELVDVHLFITGHQLPAK